VHFNFLAGIIPRKEQINCDRDKRDILDVLPTRLAQILFGKSFIMIYRRSFSIYGKKYTWMRTETIKMIVVNCSSQFRISKETWDPLGSVGIKAAEYCDNKSLEYNICRSIKGLLFVLLEDFRACR